VRRQPGRPRGAAQAALLPTVVAQVPGQVNGLALVDMGERMQSWPDPAAGLS